MDNLQKLQAANPHIAIHTIHEAAFRRYGSVIREDTSAFCAAAETIPFPETGSKYVASTPELDEIPAAAKLRETHCGGLDDIIEGFEIGTLFAPYTEFDSSGAFTRFEDTAADKGLYVTVPELGAEFTLGDAVFEFVGPVSDWGDDLNDSSLVLRLEYGETAFLFTGDISSGALADCAALGGFDLSCDVLKLGHHGSSSSTDEEILRLTRPSLAIASCGADNSYGHPHEETLSILRDAKVDVYRTDLQGTITIGSDGQNFTVGTEHFVPDSQLNPTDPAASSTAQQAYIGNVNSKKFHLPTCPNLPAEKNQILFSSYQEAVEAGYTPCSSCIK